MLKHIKEVNRLTSISASAQELDKWTNANLVDKWLKTFDSTL
jgi:hypothetical protein